MLGANSRKILAPSPPVPGAPVSERSGSRQKILGGSFSLKAADTEGTPVFVDPWK